MLKVENLTVSIQNKIVVKDANFHIPTGETHVLFGLNGSGKTSLLQAIIGNPKFKIEEGRIIFKGKDITKMPINERAKLGIGIAFQSPPAIRGVKLRDILKICTKNDGDRIISLARELDLEEFLDRDINLGFSGGEVKRAELLQLLAQNPDFILLDEPDSGVDLVNISLIGKAINKLLEKDKKQVERKKSALIITHTGHILDYVNADKGYVMIAGRVVCSGNPRDMLETIRRRGYEECVRCLRRY